MLNRLLMQRNKLQWKNFNDMKLGLISQDDYKKFVDQEKTSVIDIDVSEFETVQTEADNIDPKESSEKYPS